MTGYGTVTNSKWTIGSGVVSNASAVPAFGYPLSTAAESVLFQVFSNAAGSGDISVRFSFDYSIASGDKFYAHLWGYKGTVITPAGFVCNIEGSANGGLGNDEGSSGSGLDSFNMKDGATTGFGGAATAISGELTGSGTFLTEFRIIDLGIPGVETVDDLTYFLIAFAKEEDGTAGTTFVDNLILEAFPVQGTAIMIK